MKGATILKCLKQGTEPPRGNPNNPAPPPGADGAAPAPGDLQQPPAAAPSVRPTMPPPAAQPSVFPGAPPMMQPPPVAGAFGLQPPPSQFIAQPSSVTKSTIRRKVDPKNPYNEVGKIVKEHPKYFEVLDKAQKQMEYALNELGAKNPAKAKEYLEKAFGFLDQLEY